MIASPVGAQAVHPLGEVGVAIGTRDAGTALGLSEFASKPVAEVAAVNEKLFFQVHWSADREVLLERAETARAGGATALIVTLDWSFPGGRDWGSPAIPERLDLKNLARLAPACLARPAYLIDWLRHGGLPDSRCRTWRCQAAPHPASSPPTAPGPPFRRRAGSTSPGCVPAGRAVPGQGRHAAR